MEHTSDFHVKKALLDTQERIRDYMNYADVVPDAEISKCFREFAETEGRHAQILQGFLNN